MRIIGIGVDIVDNLRIKKKVKDKKFIKRIFSSSEINQAKKIKNKTNFYAKRFAAKESLSKAIGTGITKGLNFNDISTINDKNGKPKYVLNNKIKNLIFSRFNVKKIKISLSLADEKNYSIAFSVIHK